MYVYKRTEPGTFTVGFYTPGGQWVAESDHESREEAAARVAYLNGQKETRWTLADAQQTPRKFA